MKKSMGILYLVASLLFHRIVEKFAIPDVKNSKIDLQWVAVGIIVKGSGKKWVSPTRCTTPKKQKPLYLKK